LPSLTVTPEDHEGGGWVRVYQTKEEKLVPVTDWFRGYRELMLEEVQKAAKAEEKKP
jgi:branched-chain amino acid transport system substrate-binding protein